MISPGRAALLLTEPSISCLLIPPGANGTMCEGACSYSVLQPLLYVPPFWTNTLEKVFLGLFLKISIVKSPFESVEPVCLTPLLSGAGRRAQKCFPSLSHAEQGLEGEARTSPAFGATFERRAAGRCCEPYSQAEVRAAEPSSSSPWSS